MRHVLAVLALLAGCYKDNPNYDGGDLEPDADDTAPACETSADCAAGTPVCDDNRCVECTAEESQACEPSLVCGDNNECRPCEAHAECRLSNACLASGECADPDDVAYVASTGVGTECSSLAPCGSLFAAVDTGRPVIKLAAGTTLGQPVTLTEEAIEIVAEANAVITSGTESVLRLDGDTAAATVSDVTIVGPDVIAASDAAFSVSDRGGTLALHRVAVVRHHGTAIAVSGGDVTVDRCNIVANRGGGLDLNEARFTVTNSLFVHNGNSESPVGGVRITLAASGSKFAFNTVARNVSDDPNANGMTCATDFAFTSSIVERNTVSDTCMASYTLFDGTAQLTGVGNLPGSAAFMQTMSVSYDDPTFFRIGPTSTAIDKALLDVDVMTDIDGDARGPSPDMGADER